MPLVKTFDRNQMMFLSWDSLVGEESMARLIDAFVNSLDMKDYTAKEISKEGRPAYDPRGLYKLYIYGAQERIDSSRKLAKSCQTNLEVRWMLGGAEPDFRTISDFRKNNIKSLKKLFHEFNRRISGAVEWGFSSVDGSKFLANNSKDRNFTKNKLDDRIIWLDAHVSEYLRILNDSDEVEDASELENMTREALEEKLKDAQERLEKYKGYQQYMEENNLSQLSLTDADARLMKNKNGFAVAYNPQTVVDSETHLIRDAYMTNQPTDHGLLMPTMEGLRQDSEGEILEVVADKGYICEADMVECLESGIIPHVITNDGKDVHEIEIDYEAAEVDPASTNPEEIKKCLHAGVVPEAYKEVISDVEILERRRRIKPDSESTATSIYGSEDEMIERASQGYFVRDPERNVVYCPNGEMLRQKSIKKSGQIRYSNKNACKHCRNRNKCYKGAHEWKEIDFSKDCLEKPCRDWLKAEGNLKPTDVAAKCRVIHNYERVTVVRFRLNPTRLMTSQRMCLSEHPFGTIKRAMGSTYFLLKGLGKVEGEFMLKCLAYNFKRTKNLLGFDRMMELMVGV